VLNYQLDFDVMTLISKKKILIVDDDPSIRHLLTRFFSYNDYIVESSENITQARQTFRFFRPDLVIMDVNLPDGMGFTLCQEIRKTGVISIFLSSMSDPYHILEGFRSGADDYLIKPFNLDILKAKVEALLRRQLTFLPTSSPEHSQLTVGKMTINFDSCQVKINKTIVPLTTLEFELLTFLATHHSRVWERNELIVQIWKKIPQKGDDRKVDIHVGHIRRKIGDKDGKLIKTLWGRGYIFELPK
jgi:DNA-binding response OmpR family regulator